MKLLLYCTKGKPYLFKSHMESPTNYYTFPNNRFLENDTLNGKIIGECDYEVSEIELHQAYYNYGPAYFTKRKEPFKYFSYTDLLEASCLRDNEILKYLGNNGGYAIHIKNLKVFDEPSKLSNYLSYITKNEFPELDKPIEKAPQNMMYCYLNDDGEYYDDENEAILISIRPQWLCKILNGEKTIEIRKKVLKGMLENENRT